MMTPDGADSAIGEVLTNSDHDSDLGRESYRAWLAKAPLLGQEDSNGGSSFDSAAFDLLLANQRLSEVKF